MRHIIGGTWAALFVFAFALGVVKLIIYIGRHIT